MRTVSADSGTIVVLNDAAGRPCIAVSNIRTADDGTEERSRAVTRTGRNPAGTSLEHYGAGYHEVAELVGRRTEAAREVFYSYGDLTGSCGLELDGDGKVISTEAYYPYGGTAVWAARSAVEANDKNRRYSGKERDATGLY